MSDGVEIPPDGWKHTGVRVVPGDQLGEVNATTPG
ncbi:MAG: mannose-6-phosphate isomerase, partial [Phenylobacterium sp.]